MLVIDVSRGNKEDGNEKLLMHRNGKEDCAVGAFCAG